MLLPDAMLVDPCIVASPATVIAPVVLEIITGFLAVDILGRVTVKVPAQLTASSITRI